MQVEKSMMLIASQYKGIPTFKAIPLVLSCPYNELLYNPLEKEFGIISKEKVNMPNLVPKVDDEGIAVMAKKDKTRIAQEKRSMDVFYEYAVMDMDDAEKIIGMFCMNADSFDWKKYLGPAVAKNEFTEKVED